MSVHMSVIELRKIYTFVKLQCILIMLNISLMLCYIMLLGIILHMSFDFGNNISITYQNSPKSVFYLFLWVQAFSLVSFGIMLFFGPSFSHLACYFNHFLSKSSIFL